MVSLSEINCFPLPRYWHGSMRTIALLREYRTRLIADVVTGKLDMREARRQVCWRIDDERDPLDEGVPLESAEELAMESEVTV